MSYNYYTLDGIKGQLQKNLNESRSLLAAWENVTFPTKKDGKPFKVMTKNIAGAAYRADEYAMQFGEFKLHVHAWCDGSGYIRDDINAYELVKYMTDPAKLAKVQNLQPKQTCLEQVYTYDLDDIKEAVAAQIAYHRDNIASLEAQIQNADKAFAAFQSACAAAVKQLEADAGHRSDLYFMVRDTVRTYM